MEDLHWSLDPGKTGIVRGLSARFGWSGVILAILIRVPVIRGKGPFPRDIPVRREKIG